MAKRVVATAVALVAAFVAPGQLIVAEDAIKESAPQTTPAAHVDRSPVDLAFSPDQKWLVTANQTADSISLIDVSAGRVVQEIPCGGHPAAVAWSPDGKSVLVTTEYSGELHRLELAGAALTPAAKLSLGYLPHGMAISPDGRTAYVAQTGGDSVAIVELNPLQVAARIDVQRWPRHLALSPDGTRLAVGCAGSRTMAVIDTQRREVLYHQFFEGINPGQMQVAAAGDVVYAPWMVYRQNPITPQNIRQGWVLASRIGKVKLTGPAWRFAISLDVSGKAVSDPYGIAITSDEQWLVCTASGSHELLVYALPGLPFQDVGGPGDLIDPRLARDSTRFYRVELGGRPMAVRLARDDGRAFIANYLLNSVQVVDLKQRAVVQTIELGGPEEPSLARRGEAIFYDGRRSLDQWYSCHSCHYAGGTNAVTMDTRNDGTDRTFKTVLPLYHVNDTAPWTWHGWQKDLAAAMKKSLTDTMLGPPPADEDVQALIAYLKELAPPPNPNRSPQGLSEAARRGRQVFESSKAGCANCHSGPRFTDGEIHDVGLGSSKDVYQGYNTPSLIDVYFRPKLLHHGRANSLTQVLKEFHDPAKVTGEGELTEEALRDLVEYLKTL
jgi:YVTN family beta-propeller protein